MLLRLCTLLVLPMLALCWTESFAVELEPIQLRSRIGEALLAEIRVRDAPTDLKDLSVGLPDPVVFARIGLPRPRGVVADMRFGVHRAPGGETLIRITTSQPVAEDFLTFLVEVQWREGSLVREFSLALPPAETALAGPAMALDAPTAAAPALTAPPPDPASVDAVDSAPALADEVIGHSPAVTVPEAPPIPLVAPSRPSRSVAPSHDAPAIAVVPNGSAVPAAAATPARTALSHSSTATPSTWADTAPSPAGAGNAAGAIVVHRGSNLTRIAQAAAGDVPLETALVAFLLANPHAFADGNINRLKQGETLREPSADMLAAIDPQQARALVALQADDWRYGGDTARQQAMASLLAEIESGLALVPAAAAPIPFVPARMKIVPVEGAQSPVEARATQLDPGLHHESLAARDVEIRHLRQKITELERANDEQRELIAMQNLALAQAKRHLDGNPARLGLASWLWLLAFALIVTIARLVRGRRRQPRRDAIAIGLS